jgi:hypothetical protein
MKQCYREKRFGADALARIALCNQIIEKYQAQDLRLTLRQLYYQLVTRNAITNEEKSYKNLGSLASDARLAGLIDWDAIEDRVRRPDTPSDFSSIQDLVEAALRAYRLPRWEGQESYVKLWVEKDALAGVLQPIAQRWHVTLMVNRGYSSSSAMYESAQRFLRECYEEFSDDPRNPRSPVLLYLGDLDPSGEDMVRDVRDRLGMFGVVDLEVRKLALTMKQVEQYNPPPNPAKLSDSRAARYVEKYGTSSWEVDALPPEVLQEIITAAIREYVDVSKMNAVKSQEELDKKRLRAAAAKL